jgi:uncharacterized protein
MAINKNEVYYRIIGSSKGNTFGLCYSSDNKTWCIIRNFRLTKTDNIRIGFIAQSPSGKACTVDFSEIELQQRKVVDFWQGN